MPGPRVRIDARLARVLHPPDPMAADDKDIDVSKPKEPPKPVHIGGESLADRVMPHLKKIVISIVVIAVILSVFFAIRAWRQGKQSDATEKVAKVLQLAQRKIAAPPMPG